MSSRALRRQRARQAAIAVPSEDIEEVNNTNETRISSNKAAINPFELLEAEITQEDNVTQPSSDSDTCNDNNDNDKNDTIHDNSIEKTTNDDTTVSETTTMHSNPVAQEEDLDEIDRALREISLAESRKGKRSRRRAKGGPTSRTTSAGTSATTSNADDQGSTQDNDIPQRIVIPTALIGLLQTTARDLNEETELVRLFGTRIIQDERSAGAIGLPRNANGRMRREHNILMAQSGGIRASRTRRLAQRGPRWPPDSFVMPLEMHKLQGSNVIYLCNKVHPANKLQSTLVPGAARQPPPYNSTDSVYYFTSSKSQQKLDVEFYSLLNTNVPSLLYEFLHEYPFHIPALLHVSDLLVNDGELVDAGDLVSRVLYSYESNFIPGLSILNATARIPYAFSNNRCLHIAIFKHIGFIKRKSCWRTGLEFSKLLFSLDPAMDPLGIMLQIDMFALRSASYSWYLEFLDALVNESSDISNLPDDIKNVSSEELGYTPLNRIPDYPNHVWSKALAQFELESGSDNKSKSSSQRGSKKKNSSMKAEQTHDKSTILLEDAIVKYPEFLVKICRSLGIRDTAILDSTIYKNAEISLDTTRDKDLFGNYKKLNSKVALYTLAELYDDRCIPLWKVPEALEFLKMVASALLEVTKNGKMSSRWNTAKKRCESFDQQISCPTMTRNLVRHLVLTNDDRYLSALSSDVLSDPEVTMCSNPVPPLFTELLSASSINVSDDFADRSTWKALSKSVGKEIGGDDSDDGGIPANLVEDGGHRERRRQRNRRRQEIEEPDPTIMQDGMQEIDNDQQTNEQRSSWGVWGWGRRDGDGGSDDRNEGAGESSNGGGGGFLRNVYNTLVGSMWSQQPTHENDSGWGEPSQTNEGQVSQEEEYEGEVFGARQNEDDEDEWGNEPDLNAIDDEELLAEMIDSGDIEMGDDDLQQAIRESLNTHAAETIQRQGQDNQDVVYHHHVENMGSYDDSDSGSD